MDTSVTGSGSRNYQCLVVDDNKIASLLLVQLLEQIPEMKISGVCDSATEAAVFLSHNKTDLLFLDIEMPGMTGIELLKSLPERPLTILTSANTGYAIEAFELNVVDYIVKPVLLPRLLTAVRRAIELIEQKDVLINKIEQDHIFIKDGKTIRRILFHDIYFMEAKGDYVKIHFADKYYVIHATLKELEEKLSEKKFIRVHRSYIVAIEKIDYIEDNVLFLNTIPVPLSEFYKSRLLSYLNFL
jgi:DNA-binding LytR/AlgR family response regulator